MKFRIVVFILTVFGLLAHDLFANDMPEGWFKREKRPDTYEIGLDSNEYKTEPRSYYLKSSTNKVTSEDRATLSQVINSQKYKGKRVEFSALVKTEKVENAAYFFADLLPIIGNHSDAIKENTDWKKVSLTIYVPMESRDIHFGISLNGSGQVWVDDINVKIIGSYDAGDSKPSHINEPINLP